MSTSKRILIVDDDPDLLFLVAHGVKNLGPDYKVNTASNSMAALEQVQQHNIDLLVTDYMMPDLDGLELIKKVRQISPDTQVVLMTARHDTGQMRDNIEDLQLAGFVGKPFTMPGLLKVIQRVIKETGQKAPAPEASSPDIPKQPVKEKLKSLCRQTGAHIGLLVDSNGSPVYAVGNTDQAKISRLAAFISTNFLAITELSTLFGDNESFFRSSYYEGNNYNIYAYNINGDFFLAVVFGAGGKPGTVWFYTKQVATELAEMLPGSESTLTHGASDTLAEDFDNLLGSEEGDS